MYTIGLIIGSILIIFSIIITLVITGILIKSKEIQISNVQLAEVAATFLIGIFYIVLSSFIASETDVSDNEYGNSANFTFITLNHTIGEEESVLDEIYDVNKFSSGNAKPGSNISQILEDFIAYYKETFNNSTYSSDDSIQKLYESNGMLTRHKKALRNPSECNFNEILIKFTMLTASFIYSLISVINSTLECKEADKLNENDHGEESDPKLFTKREDGNVVRVNKCKKRMVMQLTLTFLVPVLYTLLVYLTINMPDDKNVFVVNMKPLPSEIINVIEKPLNVSSANEHEVNEVVNKIYSIMAAASLSADANKERNKPSSIYKIVDYLNDNRYGRSLSDQDGCRYKNLPLKVHTLILFIFGYFLTLLYTKNMHTKIEMRRNVDEKRSKLLQRNILAFGGLWLPSTLEIAARSYLMNCMPNVTSDICLVLGNSTRIITNVMNLLNLNNDLNKQNNVSPIE